ncbi:hypothetical protein QBC43DRAFT_306787 [Cladorrhinum sp. PSN259]|nr:hypothetical protein QBC43DRAFT_306787 [Cladorrhinum sp. PSN259]
MSDPVSLAGTAVGVVSLGITICQGVFTYLQSVRGWRQEIKDGVTEVQALLDAFGSLNDLLPDVQKQDSKTAAVLLSCLQKNESRLLDLKKLLEEFNPAGSPSGLKRKMKESVKALRYPFCQGKLQLLQAAVTRLLHSLQLELQLASLKANTSQLEKLEEIQALQTKIATSSDSASLALKTSLQDNSDKLHRLQTSVLDFASHVDTHFTEIQNNISGLAESVRDLNMTSNTLTERVGDGMDEIKSMMMKAEDHGRQHSIHLHRQLAMQMTVLQSIQSQLVPPSSGRRALPLQHMSNLFDERASSSVAAITIRSGFCTCTYPYQKIGTTRAAFDLRILSVSWFRQDRGHSPGCPLRMIVKQTKRSMSTRTRLTILNQLMRSVEIGLSFTVDRGGFQLAPFVRLKNIVPDSKSPILGVLLKLRDWCGTRIRSNEQVATQFKNAELQIIRLYENGLASPSDLGLRGDTHLSYVIKIIIWSLGYYESSILWASIAHMIKTLMSCGVSSQDTVDGQYKFESTLYGLVLPGIRLRQVDSIENDAFMFAHFVRSLDFSLEDLANSVGELNFSQLLSSLPDVLDGIEMPLIVRAILSRSITRLDHEIAKCPKETLTITHGVTSLLWCIGWPDGLQRLLNTDARILLDTPSNGFYAYPIQVAARLRCAASLDLLLQAGCAIYPGENGSFALEWSSEVTSAECMKVVAKHLAQRHRELLYLAQAHLPVCLWECIAQITTDPVPDETALELCRMLTAGGIPVPQNLRVSQSFSGVYHFNIPLRFLPIFAEAGFRGYHALNGVGLRPIMIWRDLMLPFNSVSDYSSILTATFATLQWFLDLGCFDESPEDPKALGINIRATGWHYVASLFGGTFWVYAYPRGVAYEEFKTAQSFFQKFLLKPTDGCTCWCGLEGKGCSPMNSLYKSHCHPFRYYFGVDHPDWTTHAFLHHPVSEPPSYCQQNSTSARSLELVRFLTFEALEMNHTCCAVSCLVHEHGDPLCSRWGGKCKQHTAIRNCSPEIVKNIREKESDLAQQLECLMFEFTDQMSRMHFSPRGLESFIWGYWRQRMSEFYLVDSRVVQDMSEMLNGVRTRVTPDPVRRMLGAEFDFHLDAVQPEELDKHCDFCDGLEFSDDEGEEEWDDKR